MRKKKFCIKKNFGSKKFCVKKNCTFCPLALSAVGPFVCFYNVLDLSSFGPSVFCTKRLLYQASFVPSALWTIRLLYHVPCTKCLWTKCLWTNCPGTPHLLQICSKMRPISPKTMLYQNDLLPDYYLCPNFRRFFLTL